MSADSIGITGDGQTTLASAEQMLVVQAIANSTGDFSARAVLGGLLTYLATWIVENNMDARRVLVTLGTAIDRAEHVAHAEAFHE